MSSFAVSTAEVRNEYCRGPLSAAETRELSLSCSVFSNANNGGLLPSTDTLMFAIRRPSVGGLRFNTPKARRERNNDLAAAKRTSDGAFRATAILSPEIPCTSLVPKSAQVQGLCRVTHHRRHWHSECTGDGGQLQFIGSCYKSSEKGTYK